MSESTSIGRQAALAKIEAGIAAVRDSQRFREYLAFCAKFHKYSFGNQMLIWTQRPNARQVAGYHTWQSVKRYVRKGEKGIMILAPMTGKRKRDAEDGESEEEARFTYFRPVYVFDESQTDGEDLPSPVDELAGADSSGLWGRLAEIARCERLSITREAKPDEKANGFYRRADGMIWISSELQPMQAVKTLAHELSHHFAKHDEKRHTRDECEMIAESSAYIVMSHLGFNSGEYSFGYLASWGDAKLFRERLNDVHETADAILSALEKELVA